MRIGFVGLGKLGLPCAVAMDLKGHSVMGHDVQAELMSSRPRVYRETGPDGIAPFNDFLSASTIKFGTLAEIAEHAEIIFVAVQTPHQPRFEGTTRLEDEREDFNYDYLAAAIENLAAVVKRDVIVVVISTVLPGTVRHTVEPRLNRHMRLVYNPYFIAMGTTMQDFLHPEFVLLGSKHPDALKTVKAFYGTIHQAPIYETGIENAELIKVAYNTFIGMKIAFANTLMELCHYLPNTDVDEISRGLALGTKRLLSDKYLFGGMGDGGGCHPRDNIALSWLARELGLSYDWFENVMIARERQTEWLAKLMLRESRRRNLPLAIFGYSFKAESNIVVGSPALLLKNILNEWGESALLFDPEIDGTLVMSAQEPMVFLIGSKHAAFRSYVFPKGSVVIDPWRYLEITQEGVCYIPVGVGPVVESPVIADDADESETKMTPEQVFLLS